MAKIKVLNVGPIEWFSPHFAYTDDVFECSSYDPFKQNVSLLDFCKEYKPDILLVFRGDLVRSQLYKLSHVYQIEFSSEIFPTNIFSTKRSEWLAVRKFMHCLKDINPHANLFHYDKSRKFFMESLGFDIKYHFLPVNKLYFNPNEKKDIDLLFFGRASQKRTDAFSKLKESGLKFVWIENGLDWQELSSFISRSKIVLNITAEDIDNFEPRILLGLVGGAHIITEPSVGLDLFLNENPQFRSSIRIVLPNSSEILSSAKCILANNCHDFNSVDVDFISTNNFLIKYLESSL
ncbi:MULTISPECIES: hypothetical protein [Citrobacter]|uniref:hypothetical protein n=1 Tax=Citrobacter TaxID=544 RepID=UPI0015EA1BEB|nr:MULTISPECIES: hypothetical protein [unclassified Citrobacter]MDM3403656.1 hypothetical protein [Citrobacter sp. Cb019]MDM3427160.1 hypothetical protein [Citrobacter sp. Cb026]QMD06082.1 hypothetical protein HVZ52_08550 [Citrobacter sp. RHB36-C18]